MLEARLWTRMNAYGEPIAEALRELLAEVFPSCQLMVAENFRSIRGLSTIPPDLPQVPLPSAIHPVLYGAESLSGEWELPTVMTTQQHLDFVQPSSHMDPEEIMPDERTKHGTDSQRKDECQLASPATVLRCFLAFVLATMNIMKCQKAKTAATVVPIISTLPSLASIICLTCPTSKNLCALSRASYEHPEIYMGNFHEMTSRYRIRFSLRPMNWKMMPSERALCAVFIIKMV